jgi:hypothetical protein
MSTSTIVKTQPRIILACKICKVTFVPEMRVQFKCNNCLVREEIQAKIKARVAKQ